MSRKRPGVGYGVGSGLATTFFVTMTACGSSGATGFGTGPDSGTGSGTGTHPGDGGGGTVHDAGTTSPVDASGSKPLDATSHDALPKGDVGTSPPPGDDSGSPGQDTGVPDVVVAHHDASTPQIAIVYGQSADVLYSLNPDTNAVATVGIFFGCDSDVIDIALDKSSTMYATTFGGVYTIDTSTAACTLIASGTTYPNSLSFVPAGTISATSETLVGYQESTYVSIDTTTGAMTTMGMLSNTYKSSGDIVSVIGGGTYLTVTGGSDCASEDCLVEVNPTTGALVTNYGSVQHSEVYGLAFWAGSVYGFDNGGDLFKVTFPDAGGLGITTIPIPNPPFGLSFNGAGSTTSAPRK